MEKGCLSSKKKDYKYPIETSPGFVFPPVVASRLLVIRERAALS
jgi:hypothetical protein